MLPREGEGEGLKELMLGIDVRITPPCIPEENGLVPERCNCDPPFPKDPCPTVADLFKKGLLAV